MLSAFIVHAAGTLAPGTLPEPNKDLNDDR